MGEPSILQVFVFRDGAYVGNEVFTEPEVVIGSGAGVDLVLEDETVEPSHALLKHENGEATLLRLSRGAVYVNHADVDHTYVTPRDEIQVGGHTLKFKFIQAKGTSTRPQIATTPPRPAPPHPSQAHASRAPVDAPASSSARPSQLPRGAGRERSGHLDTRAGQLARPLAPQAGGSTGGAPSGTPRDVALHARLADDLSNEAMTEVVTAEVEVESTRAPLRAQGASRRPRATPEEETLAAHEIARAISAITSAMEPGASALSSAEPLRSGSLSPDPLPPKRPLDAEWSEVSENTLGPEASEELSAALDAAFVDAPTPAEEVPVPTRAAPREETPAKRPRSTPPPPPPASPVSSPVTAPITMPPLETLEALAAEDTRPREARPAKAAQERTTEPETSRPPTGQTTGANEAPRGRASSTRGRPPAAFDEADLGQDRTGPAAIVLPAAGSSNAQLPHGVLPHEIDDLDEDELDARTRPDFSLIDALVGASEPALGLSFDGKPALEIIGFGEDDVRSAALLRDKGERYVLGAVHHGVAAPMTAFPGLKLARLVAADQAEIEFPAGASGTLVEGDRRVSLETLKVPENAVAKGATTYRTKLRAGATATVNLGDTSFFVRFVRPPVVAKQAHGPLVDWKILRAVGSSVVAHVVALVVVALLSPGLSYSDGPREAWADVRQDLRDVEIKPPEPKVEPPAPEPEKTIEPEPEKPQPAPKEQPKPQKKVQRAARPGPVTAERPQQPEIKSVGVLGAMGKLNLAAPGKKSVVQAVSNLDAVRAPGGSNFRVGALIGKLPASGVSVGGGGGGTMLTRGGAELLRGGEGLATLGKKGDTKVRGSVGKINARQVEAKGSISREEVARVINQHMAEVQYCYERTLLKEPGLTGKLILEWTIEADGTVGRVKEKLSTMRNPAVSTCISERMRRWQFPKPQGGIVIVSYPFIFNPSAF